MEMKIFNIGLIRVITTNNRELLNFHGNILHDNFPFKVESSCIPNQYTGVYSEETYLKAVPKVIDLAVELEKKGKDGIIISCAEDPGVEEAKRILQIPVVGAGATVASIALGYSTKVGVLNLMKSTPEGMKRILGKHLIAEKTVNAKNTLELTTFKGVENIIQFSLKLKQLGAEVIALACTGMSTVNTASRIKEKIDIPCSGPSDCRRSYYVEFAEILDVYGCSERQCRRNYYK